jgi:hypothetical protein
MKTVFFRARPLLLLSLFLPLAMQSSAQAQTTFTVGQKVDAGGGYKHKATVLQVKPPSYFLHYDDGSLPDGWEEGYSMRPRTGDAGNGGAASAGANGSAAVASAHGGPRNGKYGIWVYNANHQPMYDGYFMLNGSSYEVFLPGGKPGGSGQCRFDAGTATMHWVSGPLANPVWNGTQKFEVDGNNQKIRLKADTVGWSTGS